MRTNIFKTGVAAVFMSLVTVNQALAWCGFGGNGPGCSTQTVVETPPVAGAPEIDGAGAMLAIALVLSIGAMVYRRVLR
jgi:hypothetical protein